MKRPLGPWVRWGWLATTIAMGAVLMVTAWVGRERAVAAATTLNRGQSLILLESIRQQARGMSEPLQGAELDTLLRQHNAAGLRYLAFFDSSGTVLAQSGTPAQAITHLARRPPGPPVMEQIGCGDSRASRRRRPKRAAGRRRRSPPARVPGVSPS
jgi:hypothetical protein